MNYIIIKKGLGVVCMVTLLVVAIACSHDNSGDNSQSLQSVKSGQVKNTASNEVRRLSEVFVLETKELESLANEFTTSATLDNLKALKEQWLKTLKVWKQLELYNVGAIEDSFIHFEINRWPTNPSLIEEKIAEENVINESLIASSGSSSKGISAMEYLLFYPSDETALLSKYTVETNHTGRTLYLKALAENLVLKAEKLASDWKQNEEVFIANLSGGLDDSQNQLANAMIGLLEEMIIKKIGNPLGDAKVESLEAHYSHNSAVIVQEHLIVLERCYLGDFVEGQKGLGFEDFLIEIQRSDIDSAIKNQFAVCKQKMQGMTQPFEVQIEGNPLQMAELKDELTKLHTLLKTDMASAIGIVLTIGDSDGD
ncbi:MAG: imelysin family protein [Flavobacteriales bacterium]|nr:imelysin family protein [Flavobacteriales bacterium]